MSDRLSIVPNPPNLVRTVNQTAFAVSMLVPKTVFVLELNSPDVFSGTKGDSVRGLYESHTREKNSFGSSSSSSKKVQQNKQHCDNNKRIVNDRIVNNNIQDQN